MATKNDLTETIAYFAMESRPFIVALDVGGEPPTLDQVIGSYHQVSRDIGWAWQLAEVMPYTMDDEKSPPEWIATRLDYLRTANTRFEPVELDKWMPGFWTSESANPQPQARVIGSEHSNPLETLILVTASSSVMLITSVMWAVRKWHRAQGERRIMEAQARILESVAESLSQGDDKKTKLLTPIAVGIVQGAQVSAMHEDRVDIRVSPGLTFGIGGQAQKKSRVRKQP